MKWLTGHTLGSNSSIRSTKQIFVTCRVVCSLPFFKYFCFCNYEIAEYCRQFGCNRHPVVCKLKKLYKRFVPTLLYNMFKYRFILRDGIFVDPVFSRHLVHKGLKSKVGYCLTDIRRGKCGPLPTDPYCGTNHNCLLTKVWYDCMMRRWRIIISKDIN